MKTKIALFILLLLIGFSLDTFAQQRKSKKKKAKQSKVVKKKASIKKLKTKQTATASVKAKGESLSVAYSVSDKTNSDTGSTRTVIITSAFKPSLQNAAKINFTAATAVADSSRLPLTYKVPSSNLFFSYQPIPLKPLALPTDSPAVWKNTHRVKAGAGNLSSFFGEGRFSFGDGKKMITQIQTSFVRSKGKLYAQQYSKFDLDVLSVINTTNNLEWTSHAQFNSTTRYRYGFMPNTLVYPKDELQLVYNGLSLEVGVKNKQRTQSGIDFHPIIQFNRFTNTNNAGENNIIIKAPIEKFFGKMLGINITANADMAKYSSPSTISSAINNNLYSIDPSILLKTPNVKLNLGIKPTWNNGVFNLLPNFTLNSRLPNSNFSVEAGFKGSFYKNSFRSLAQYNPWIALPNQLRNTRSIEQYIGLNGSTNNHFSFNAQVALMQMKDQPIFFNQLGDGKAFDIVYTNMNALKLSGEINYTFQEKLSLLASASYSNFSKLDAATDAFGLIPLETTAGLIWKPIGDLQVKADLFYRSGSLYRDSFSFTARRLSPAMDMNLGFEFGIMPKLNLWLQMNNLFNNTYQRWNQYPVFGFNVMGGVVYSFQ
ncbi:hypothetical protein [Sediminibacterium sp.]|uniref:hypothetical protein n=1 Tax=Sediminibacterium sp. TaxID=1917865 RepID=UPI0027333625|nr:hypothetical protein [Sediminibacterium sp.]MDP3393827.1 hypothetical protein [Sediminibacterium sp.]MDP3568843.1 hypothetical protein [Sediminibacterium sp.]